MEFFIIIVHVLAALGIIGLVLIQQGKGADMGAAFGSGASQTMFGSAGTGNVLSKSTTWLAVMFFATSLALALLARQRADQGVTDNLLIQNVDQLQSVIQESAAPAPLDNDVPAVAPSDIPVAVEEIEESVNENSAENENTLEQTQQ
jgi:preprotein translocase subunit SecG